MDGKQKSKASEPSARCCRCGWTTFEPTNESLLRQLWPTPIRHTHTRTHTTITTAAITIVVVVVFFLCVASSPFPLSCHYMSARMSLASATSAPLFRQNETRTLLPLVLRQLRLCVQLFESSEQEELTMRRVSNSICMCARFVCATAARPPMPPPKFLDKINLQINFT